MATSAPQDIAIVGYAQSPSWRQAELTEPQFLFPVIEQAIQHVLDAGHRTADIGAGIHASRTSEMGELICEAVAEIADMRYAYHAV